MPLVSQIRSWLSGSVHRSRAEGEMDAEMAAHLENRVNDLKRAGMTREEAHRRARIEFGGIENFKEACRDAKRANLLESLLQDLHYAFRMLRKSPGFTGVAVVTLALGIGANTAVFSVVHAVVLRPLPYKDSSRLYDVSLHSPMFPTLNLGLTWPAFQAIRSGVPALEESSVYAAKEKTLTGDGNPSALQVFEVSDGFFEEFGVTPQLGRLFSEPNAAPGENRILVLSDRFWRTRFGSDPHVIGSQIILDKEPWTVVGVASAGFDYPGLNYPEQAWAPLALAAQDKTNQMFFMLQFVGKLRKGQTPARLKGQLSAIAHRLVTDHPELGEGYAFSSENLLEGKIHNVRPVYFVLLGAATLVLLIACANLASLLLARGTGRRREMALRAALGASRSRLLRQGFVESCLLALLGGALGVLLAAGGVQFFRTIAPGNTPRLEEISIDATLLWFSLGTSLLAGILFGLAPARRAARLYPNEALKEGSGAAMGASRSASQMRLGNALVVAEVALAFILLVGSALMVQTVTRLLHQPTGFRTDHLLTFDLPQLPGAGSRPAETEIAAGNERLDRVFAEIARLPGVAGVTASSHGILDGMSMMMSGLEVQGAVPERPGAERHAVARYVDPSYFSTLGIPLLRGNDFAARVSAKTPSEIIVNETMAQEYWGTVDVVGRHISCSRDNDGKPVWSDVIAVVGNARETKISHAADPAYYLSMRQPTNGQQHIFVRTQSDTEPVAAAVTQQLRSLFPDQPVSNVMSMTRVISDSVGDQKLRGILLTVFAGVGFVLALVGAYGVISYSVSRRVQEIGVRMALGARSSSVLRMVLAKGLLLVTFGVALGAVASFAFGRLVAGQLYGVTATDPLTFFGAAAFVFAVACAACLIPARRASRVDPIVALRYE